MGSLYAVKRKDQKKKEQWVQRKLLGAIRVSLAEDVGSYESAKLTG